MTIAGGGIHATFRGFIAKGKVGTVGGSAGRVLTVLSGIETERILFVRKSSKLIHTVGPARIEHARQGGQRSGGGTACHLWVHPQYAALAAGNLGGNPVIQAVGHIARSCGYVICSIR